MELTELAWAAGMFEGEGAIRIDKPQKRNTGALILDLANVSATVVAFYCDRWGGSIREYHPGGNRRSYFRWRVAARQAVRFLNDVLPYFQTLRYRERALLAIEFQGQKVNARGQRASAEYRQRQFDYYERMRILNIRGAQGQLAFPASGRRISATTEASGPRERTDARREVASAG